MPPLRNRFTALLSIVPFWQLNEPPVWVKFTVLNETVPPQVIEHWTLAWTLASPTARSL